MRTADIQNSYIQEKVAEKIWTVMGPNFGPDAGKPDVIVRALYRIKSDGASFQNHFADCLKHMEYMSFPEYPDLWMKQMVIPRDGAAYYAYILLYVDDILCFHRDAESVLRKVDKYFKLNSYSIGEPNMHLGSKVRPMDLDDGVSAWALSPSQYI